MILRTKEQIMSQFGAINSLFIINDITRMKYIITTILVVLLNQAMGQESPVIVGKIADLQPTMVYLEGEVGGNFVDSCFCTNGSFRLEQKRCSKPFSGMVYYKNVKGVKEPLSPIFIVENKQIDFTGRFNDWKSYKIRNSEETRILHCMLLDLNKNDNYLRQVIDSSNQNLAINKGKYVQALTEYKEIVRKYAEAYPKSFAVAEVISLSPLYYKSEDYEMMLNNELRSNPYAQKFRRYFALKKGITVPLTVRDSNGTKITLNRKLKRNTLLVTWFVGCAPCREELTYLETVDRSNLPFDIVTLSIDTDKETWRKYLHQLKWSRRNYLWDVASARKSGIYKYPTCILVDKNGVVIDPSFDVYSLK